MHKNPAVDDAIEALCHRGCRQVWHDIAALERGEVLPQTTRLDAAERVEVLTELKAIMAVYDATCSPD